MAWRQVVRGTVGVLLLSLGACSQTVYHSVRPGETLSRIGQAYGVSVDQLAGLNHLADPGRIEVGQRLLIRGTRRDVPVERLAPHPARVAAVPHDDALRKTPALMWPVDGATITAGFGQRGTAKHMGIDLSAPAGTFVHAAEAGDVSYSGVLGGYGNLIIVRHGGGVATVYAHNARNLVRSGQQVRPGEVIATVGNSGHAPSANLHFEVRQDNVARDPLIFLPRREPLTLSHAGQ